MSSIKQKSSSNSLRSKIDEHGVIHHRRRRSSSSIQKLKSLSSVRGNERWSDKSGNWAIGTSTDTAGPQSTSSSEISSSGNDDSDSTTKLIHHLETAKPPLKTKIKNKSYEISRGLFHSRTKFGESVLILIGIGLGCYRLYNEYNEINIVIQSFIIALISVLFLIFKSHYDNEDTCSRIWCTSFKDYRQTNDSGLIISLLLMPLLSLTCLCSAYDQSVSHANWMVDKAIISDPEVMFNDYINSRRDLVSLSHIMTIMVIIHVTLSTIWYSNSSKKDDMSESRRLASFTLVAVFLSSLTTLIVALLRTTNNLIFSSECYVFLLELF